MDRSSFFGIKKHTHLSCARVAPF